MIGKTDDRIVNISRLNDGKDRCLADEIDRRFGRPRMLMLPENFVDRGGLGQCTQTWFLLASIV